MPTWIDRAGPTVLAVVGMVLAAAAARGDDAWWPQFRGPGGQGHAQVAEAPLVWSETSHVAWKTPLEGRGWSSPVVADGQVWLTAARDEGRSLRAVCVDLANGCVVRDVEVFRIEQPDSINPKNSYASPTPVLDGQGRVYVHFGTFGTACLETATGRSVWTSQELQLDHKEGPGSSPLIWNNLLVLPCDGLDVQYIAALDRFTGRVVWKTDRTGANNPNPDFRKAYSTPLVIDHQGQPQLISAGADRLYAYDPATGDELWWVDYNGFSVVPRPVFAHGLLYVVTNYGRPALSVVRPGTSGDLTASNVVWSTTQQVPASPSLLVVDDLLYMVSNRGVATCLDARTGEEVWTERLGGNFSASPLYAAGRIYFWSEEGTTTVIRPGRTFELLAENQLDGAFMATPAALAGALIVRTDTHLYRIGTR
jgi:outer membrane protein assembly factor BamB